jgi:hypothetical protein
MQPVWFRSSSSHAIHGNNINNNNNVLDIPNYTDFSTIILQRRRIAIKSVCDSLDKYYLPFLKTRLAKWCRCTTTLEYVESLPSNILGDDSIHLNVTNHIKKRIKEWLEPKGYKNLFIWISKMRVVIKFSTHWEITDMISEQNEGNIVKRGNEGIHQDDVSISIPSSMEDLANESMQEQQQQRHSRRDILGYRVNAFTRFCFV